MDVKRSLLVQLGGDESVSFDALLEEVLLAEELGVETVWCFPSAGEAGDFAGAAPEIWISALASRTERIRIGWGLPGLTPPVIPPLRTAEQGASLDLACAGRLEVGLIPDGVLPSDSNANWDEGVRMLVDMWDEPKFSWTSERFEVRPVDVVPKPVQRPHPPIWLAGWSDDHARSAGRAGLGFLDISGGDDEQVELHGDAYRSGRSEADPHDLVSTEEFGVVADLEPGEASLARIEAWDRLGVDHAVVRIETGAHAQAGTLDRIRFLTTAETQLH